MTDRSRAFGSVAAAYERYRPGYPAELADLVIDYATAPTLTALEIGAGTGKATRLFAARGISVLATDPDPQMLAELRAQLPGTRTLVAALEQVRPTAAYDLVYSAAALHWTDPASRWDRVAALLRPQGTFASIGGPLRLTDAVDRLAVAEAQRPDLDTDEVAPPDGSDATGPGLWWPGTELAEGNLFTDVRQTVIERRIRMAKAGYVGYLSTVSAYLQLPAGRRTAVLDRIAAALPDHVGLTGDLVVHLARRSPPARRGRTDIR